MVSVLIMLKAEICVVVLGMGIVFFYKQKTAYEMRISDWSSDVCSSDLFGVMPERPVAEVRYDRLRFVEPLMEREIVVRRPAPAARRGKRMVIKIGRASCRERVCQDVKISVVAVSVKNK